MCGIVGLASSVGNSYAYTRKSIFNQLLAMDSFRGEESTGIACVRKDNPKSSPDIYKKAIIGWDFVQLQKSFELIEDMDKYAIVIGHNRAATKGMISDRNSHPFQYGPITLVHNGTVHNYNSLCVNPKETVDSAHVAMSMAENGTKETLEKIRGGYALVWHDASDGTLNIARNNMKPLVFCYEQKENTMYFASELEMLYSILTRNGVKIEGKFKVPTPLVHYKFNINNLREYEKFPFIEAPVQSYQTDRGQFSDGRWVPKTKTLVEANGNKESSLVTKVLAGVAGPTGMTTEQDRKHQEELDKVFCAVEKEADKDHQTGRPTSIKKQRKVMEDLTKIGIKFEQSVVVIPDEYIPYKNQKGFGAVVGSVRNHPNIKAQVNSIGLERWRSSNDRGALFAKVVNFKQVKGTPVVVCVEHIAKEELPVPSNNDFVKGPKDTMVSPAKFLELTKDGCGYCSTAIAVGSAKDLLWAGDGGSQPLCPSCAKNEEILTTLGLLDLVTKPRPNQNTLTLH